MLHKRLQGDPRTLSEYFEHGCIKDAALCTQGPHYLAPGFLGTCGPCDVVRYHWDLEKYNMRLVGSYITECRVTGSSARTPSGFRGW